MAQTRLQAASQGLMENFDEVQRGWTLVGLLCLVAVFMIGYLVVSRKQREKAERMRLQRQQEKSVRKRQG